MLKTILKHLRRRSAAPSSEVFDADRVQLQAATDSAPLQIAADDTLARGDDGVNQRWYLDTNADVAAVGMDPVEHYLQFGWREGRDPRPDFSTHGYLMAHDEVARTGQNPLIHYLRNGGVKGASLWYSFWKKGFLHPKLGEPPPAADGSFGTSNRRKILFVGHEASRTGAPLILLALMQAIERQTGAELFLILERDGPLLNEYRRVAHVLTNLNRALDADLILLIQALAGPGPEAAICNTAETGRLMRELRAANLPCIVSLVHETMTYAGDEICRLIHDNANRVIFPAHAVKTSATRAFTPFRDADVLPQGLLYDRFGLGDKATVRRTVRDKLGLASETKIVFSCGVREPRKGLDLFVQLAARVRSQTSVPVHFLWLGGDERPTIFKKFVRHDISLLDLDATISLVDETADTEPYFLAADAYALTSRDDPFPCVVHQAMACELPVVGFRGAGGAGEALADGCGVMVPYLDLDAMAHCLCSMLERPADFAEMGKRAGRRVRTVYRFSEYAPRILAICAEVRRTA